MEERVKRAEARADEAEVRANEAEDRAYRTEEEHAFLDALLKDCEECLKAVEAQVAKLEEDLKTSNEQSISNISSEEVIKNYLTFEEFQDEHTDCRADSFSEGFTECHHQIHKLYPDLDIGELKEVYDDGGDD